MVWGRARLCFFGTKQSVDPYSLFTTGHSVEKIHSLYSKARKKSISIFRLKPTAIRKYSPTQCRGSRRMFDTSQPVNSAYPSSVMRALKFLKNFHSTKRKKWLIDFSISLTEHTTLFYLFIILLSVITKHAYNPF